MRIWKLDAQMVHVAHEVLPGVDHTLNGGRLSLGTNLLQMGVPICHVLVVTGRWRGHQSHHDAQEVPSEQGGRYLPGRQSGAPALSSA